MQTIRFGVIGVGNMGSFYARSLHSGAVPRATLAAVADADPARRAAWSGVAAFPDAASLCASGEVDAVIVATPHYDHTVSGVIALEAGLHVLVDKPISVHKADARRLLAAHRDPRQVFAAMFNQRTDGCFLKIKELLDGGALGEVRRVHWIITNWFRSEAYYASSAWRATWSGEGGGVLLNQCPHQLDLLCWLFGSPVNVLARAGFGKYHAIEVEDEVTAFFDYANGATGVLVAGTGEAPGTNRLEIAAENGKLVLEGDVLTWWRNEQPMSVFSRTTTELFAAPAVTKQEWAGLPRGEQHLGVLKNVVAAVLDGEPLIAPAAEGLASVELANAMLLSAWEGREVALPLDAACYEERLREKMAASTVRRRRSGTPAGPVADMTGSFR